MDNGVEIALIIANALLCKLNHHCKIVDRVSFVHVVLMMLLLSLNNEPLMSDACSLKKIVLFASNRKPQAHSLW